MQRRNFHKGPNMQFFKIISQKPVALIEITSFERTENPQLVKVNFTVNIKGIPIKTHLIFLPPTSENDLDHIEKKGVTWSRECGFFSKEAVEGLEATNVGALVGLSYPSSLGMEKLEALDQWLRVAFYLDKIFDNLNASQPNKIYKLRMRVEDLLSGKDRIRDIDPPVIKGVYNTYFDYAFFNKMPFFKESFLECLQENEQEAHLRLEPNLLDEETIVKIRLKSCGGYHSLVAGCASAGIDAKSYFSKFTHLKTMGEQVSLCTGWSNDIVSAQDEFEERDKVLSTTDTKTYQTLNLVHNKVAHLQKAFPGKAFEELLPEAVAHVAEKFNREVLAFFNLEIALEKELTSKEATAQERADVEIIKDVMKGWIKMTAWELLTQKYAHGSPCTAETLRVFADQMAQVLSS